MTAFWYELTGFWRELTGFWCELTGFICVVDWLKFQTYSIHTRLDRLLFSGSKALQKWKNFENLTTFRYAYLPSKFYYIAPLMNYSQYSLEGYKILVSGLGKNLKRILRSMYICLKEKWKKKFWGHPRGVRQTPKNGQNPWF